MAIKSLVNNAWEDIDDLKTLVNDAYETADHANALVNDAWEEVWGSYGYEITFYDGYVTNPSGSSDFVGYDCIDENSATVQTAGSSMSSSHMWLCITGPFMSYSSYTLEYELSDALSFGMRIQNAGSHSGDLYKSWTSTDGSTTFEIEDGSTYNKLYWYMGYISAAGKVTISNVKINGKKCRFV